MQCKSWKDLTRNIRRLKIFTQIVSKRGRRKCSIAMLWRAKKVVLKEIDRLERLVWDDRDSTFERAFFNASGEVRLQFNFADMRDNVINAQFGVKDLHRTEDFGHNDGLHVVINKHQALNQTQMEMLLLHEALHHNVMRSGRPGNQYLNDDMEHLAMAILGDPTERHNVSIGYLICPFPNCERDACPNTDWID